MKVKAVIFDCDGTLIDSEYSHFLAWRHAIQNQGGSLLLDEYYSFVGKSAKLIAQLFAEQIPNGCPEKILKDKRAHYDKLQLNGIPAISPTVDFVHRLAKEKQKFGLKLGVASAGNKIEILNNLRHLGIEGLFDIILSGHDDLSDYTDSEGTNKPKPYIYLHTAKLLKLNPKECVVIEDSASGIAAGVDAGCTTIAVPNTYTHMQDLSRAQLKIESFANISVEEFLQMIESLASSKN